VFAQHTHPGSRFPTIEHYEIQQEWPHEGMETVLDLCARCYDALERRDWETLARRRHGDARPSETYLSAADDPIACGIEESWLDGSDDTLS
jgi:hypothetical protein